MIAKTDNLVFGRWAVLAGEGEEAYVVGYAASRGAAAFRAKTHPANCVARTCSVCNGAKILLEGPLDTLSIDGDLCPRCDGDGEELVPLPHAASEVSLAELRELAPEIAH